MYELPFSFLKSINWKKKTIVTTFTTLGDNVIFYRDNFRRKFTSRVEEPLGTYYYGATF